MSQQRLNIPELKVQNPVVFTQNPYPPQVYATTSMQGTESDTYTPSGASYYANRAKASVNEENDPMVTAGLGAAIWYAISQGMDKFNPKCGGDYNKSFFGKIGALGDKFSTENPIGKKFQEFVDWTNTKFTKLSGKSKISYSLQNHSTRPEWSLAKFPGAGLMGFTATDTESFLEEFLKPIGAKPKEIFGFKYGEENVFQKLEQYGLSNKEIQNFAKSLRGKSFKEQAFALQKKEIELLGGKANLTAGVPNTEAGMKFLQDMARDMKLKRLGFNNFEEFSKLKGKFLDNPDKIIKMLDKAATDPVLGKVKISVWRSGEELATEGGITGKIKYGLSKAKSHLFGRTVTFSEYRNKWLVSTGKGNKTTLGRLLPKMAGWLTEGCTNRFAGGKLACMMQAGIFADMVYNTVKAPSGEKIKTFAERFTNDFMLFAGATLGMLGMHKIGGFKYAGLDVNGREAYRKALTEFNEKAANKGFANKNEYKAAKKALKEKLGTKNIKNPITKLLQKIGSFINIGNEAVGPYQSRADKNLNLLRKISGRNILGVPLRIFLVMGLATPFISKHSVEFIHKIFGRPTKSVLDEENEEETPKTDEQAAHDMVNSGNLSQNDRFIPNNANNTQPQYNPVNPQNLSESNLIRQTVNGAKPQQAQQPQRRYIPSPECKVPRDKNVEATRTYIPSPVGMVKDTTDTSAADIAMANADKAEQFVNETLAQLRMQ